VKKVEVPRACPIFRCFEPFDPFNHEESTKTKVFLKVWLEVLQILL
jgi:hypothetical protein